MPRQLPRALSGSLFILAFTTLLVMGDDGPQRDRPPENPLRETLEDANAQGADFWVYNDIPSAIEEARRLDRPLFVTFRCIPCRDCMAFDAEVAQGSDAVREMADKYFVPVRQVEMEGVDLTQFQFDHDLNWAAVFIHPDGTVLARYGTQSAEGADAYNSVEGLLATMQRVRALYADYPDNQELFAGKKPEQKPYETALDMPGLENPERFETATTRESCIHCHNIHDAENFHAYETGTMSDDLVFRYPYPDNVGLSIDPASGVKIDAVIEDSPAADAGFEVGEDIVTMNGQAITSIADMQWVLHHIPAEGGEVTIVASESGEHTLALEEGWKEYDISWRGSMWSMPPRLHIWMPELADERERELDLGDDESALEVRWINQGEESGRAAQEAGLREGDVVVALNGEPINLGPSQFMAHIKLNYEVGDEITFTIVRDGKRQDIVIPLVH
jgi:hypothetical protein